MSSTSDTTTGSGAVARAGKGPLNRTTSVRKVPANSTAPAASGASGASAPAAAAPTAAAAGGAHAASSGQGRTAAVAAPPGAWVLVLVWRLVTLPWRITRWAVTLFGVWVMCVLGLCLSSYGYWKTLRNTPRKTPQPDTSLDNIASPRVSVIIPAYNEQGSIGDTIRSVLDSTTSLDDTEIVVVDASSSDNTLEAAREELQSHTCRFKAVRSASGRAVAHNVGVENSTGEILLFLHADCLVPRGYDDMIRQKLKQRGVVAGAFKFAVNRKSFKGPCPIGIGTMEGFANFRARNYQLPYGDQAMFMTRERFRRQGPFPNVMMMEDFEMTRRLRSVAVAEGGRVVILDAPAMCSGRRWEKNGVVKNTLLNQVFVFAYTSLGYSATQIYNWYYGANVPEPTAQ